MFAYCGNNPVHQADFDGNLIVAVIYDDNDEEYGHSNVHNRRTAKQIYLAAGLDEDSYVILKPVKSASKFVEAWESLSNQRVDVVVILVHGSPGKLHIKDETIGSSTSDTYHFDDLCDLKLNQSVSLLSCYGGADSSTGSVAKHLANKTHAPVVANTSTVDFFTTPLYTQYYSNAKGMWIMTMPDSTYDSHGMNRMVIQ